jgi:hypothetical protein
MSTNGLLNVSGVDGNGGGSGGGGSTFPGGIDKSVQFNDGGLIFGGVSSFLYDKVAATLSVTKTKPTQIIDASNSTGTAGQVLSSTGTGLQYITPTPPTVPGLPNASVQFNNGGVFSGNAAMIFDGGANRLIVEQIKPTVIVDKFNLIGTAGQVLSSTGSDLQYITPTPPTVPAAPPASVQFNNGGVFGGDADFTYDVAGDTLNVPGISCTGIGAGKVDTNLLEPVQIIDDLNSTGTAGQVLSSTGTGIRFVTPTVVAPGAPNTSVQFNQGGVFTGDSDFTYSTLSDTLNVPNIYCTGIGAYNINTTTIKPTQIIDGTNTTGTSGQVLKSTGTGIVFANEVAPGAPTTSVQFNQGGVFTGDSGFTFNNTSKRLIVPAGVRTNTIYDITGGAGSINQVLTSNGVVSTWQDPQYAPGVPLDSIQFNNNGVFGGSANFVRNPSTNAVNINGNVGIGSLSAPPDRLTVTGSNATASVITDTATAQLVVRTSDTNQKQFIFQVNGSANTGDITSIQQGSAFRPVRINPGLTTPILDQGRLSIGTNSANAAGIQLNNGLFNRKIILFESANNDHQYHGLGVNTGAFRFQIPDTVSRYAWFAGTASNASNELMRLTGTGQLTLGTGAASTLTISKGTGTTASNSLQGYIKVGGSEYGTVPGTRRMIGFGYNTGANNQPAYIGYEERVTGGDSCGDLIFGTRTQTTLDVVPTERMRILANGNVGIGTSVPGTPLEVLGTIRSISLEVTGAITSASLQSTQIIDGFLSTGTNGQVLTSTGIGLLWDELTPRFFFDSNATFQGTTGHRIHVSIQKKNTLYSVQVSMQRDGGIHFDLPSPGLTVGTQIIATLPVGWRPPASVDGIGYASNNNSWATQAFNWGSLNIDTSGNIRMRSPASGSPITNIQPNLEQITCSIFWLSSGTVYNSDGITR